MKYLIAVRLKTEENPIIWEFNSKENRDGFIEYLNTDIVIDYATSEI